MFFGYIDPGSGFTIISLGSWLLTFLMGFFGIFLIFYRKIFNKKNAKKIIIIVVTLATIISIIGVIMNANKSKFNKKIIILGFDGLSPNIIEPMMAEGKLPNFSRLKNLGAYKHLATTNPPQSPVAWAGFVTGQNPGKNGIFDFIIRDPKTYNIKLSTSNIIGNTPERVLKSKPFWHYTSLLKLPTVIINCPLTFPPAKICGKMLSGMGVPDIVGTEGTFTFYTSAVQDEYNDIDGKTFFVSKNPQMIMHFVGPKIAAGAKDQRTVKVPFKATLGKDKLNCLIEYQNNNFNLKKGIWSDWQEVNFKLDPLRSIKGIVKLLLVEVDPDFKLYISPINFDPRSPFFKISYPSSYSKELADNIGLYHTRGMPQDTWALNEKKLTEEQFLQQANDIFNKKKAMLDFELARLKKGILFCYFESPDVIQHMFWRYTDPQHPLYEPSAPQEYKEMIQNWYKKMDNVLGSIINQTAQDDTLIVLSDHGFATFRRTVNVNTWLRQNGYLELKNPQDSQGAELLKDIDWNRTKAYAIGFGAIYINQKGREGNGIVSPGEETAILKKELLEKLKQWSDKKYNLPVVKNVYKKEDIFHGNYVSYAPDLYIGFNTGYRASWQTALGAVPELLIEDNLKKWSGDHLYDPALVPGVIFCNKQITKSSPSIYDITPTILNIIGFSTEKLKTCDFDGSSLF